MLDLFKEFIHSQNNVSEIKGKLAPLLEQHGIQEVESIWILSAVKQNLPVIFIKKQNKYYMGITLARQSSDLLVAIGKKIIKNNWKNDVPKYMVQYRFPKDLNSLKLVLYCEWAEIDQYKEILESLIRIQEKFLDCLEKIAESIL